MTPLSDPGERLWIDYADSVLRWRRFVVTGLLVSWTLILGAHWLLPRAFECEATLSFPPVITKGKEDETRRPGIPLALYKKLSKLLANEQVLRMGMSSVLQPAEIGVLEAGLGNHVSALTTSPLTDIRRIGNEDTVIGLQLAYVATPGERSRKVVEVLATLCRSAFLNLLVMEHMSMESAEASARRALATRKRAELIFGQTSLERLAADTRRLMLDFPGLTASGSQQVVDAREGGSLYLPPTLQLVGVRARLAEEAHKLRLLDRQIRHEGLRLELFREIDERVYGGLLGHAALRDGIGTLVLEDFAHFKTAHQEEASELEILSTETEVLAASMAGYEETTRLVQLPTVRRQSRAGTTLFLLAAATLLVLVSAILGESWRQLHGAATASTA
jgi:hypothetical protein